MGVIDITGVFHVTLSLPSVLLVIWLSGTHGITYVYTAPAVYKGVIANLWRPTDSFTQVELKSDEMRHAHACTI